ncbi:MAG: hypothetical protein EKK57_09715 [Proteobacteria bacterium]|nr:MAG: hypothetical protein EKK57_09715 [Pseudomonadota bacterium]
MYDFQTQLAIGKEVENALDTYFSKWYHITPVSLDSEKNHGVDRIFTSIQTAQQKTVEYKADFKTYKTGNMYVELSVDSDSGYTKNGWALHSIADVIIYAAISGTKIVTIYIFSPFTVREYIDKWKGQYRNVVCKNKGYHSKGVLVPIREVEVMALRTIKMI